MGIKFDEEIQGFVLLGSLPNSWVTFRTSLSNSAPDGVISMNSANSNVKTQSFSSSNILITGLKGRNKTVIHIIENKIGANLESDLRMLSAIIVV